MTVTNSPFLAGKGRQQQPHLAALRERCRGLLIVAIPLFPQEVRCVERMGRVAQLLG